jgi:hypothetical protein
MIGLLSILSLALIIAVGFMAIPGDVRAMIAANCRGSKGQLKAKYVLCELNAVAEFYGGVLFVSAIFAVTLLFVAIQVNDYLIPVEFAKSAIQQADWDVATWKQNLTSGTANVRREHEQWVVSNGGSVADARNLQTVLWSGFPIAVGLTFASLVLCLRLTSSRYDAALEQLIKRSVKRDRERVTTHYLQTTAQVKHHHHGD